MLVLIDMPMPKTCMDCPCSYWIQSGEFEDMLMCNALESKLAEPDTTFDAVPKCLVDEYTDKKPGKCPIVGECGKVCTQMHHKK